MMVKAIEARDPYTSGHSLRVSQLSRLIALEMGLQIRDVEQVHTAALLHDVGKIHEEFAPLLRKEDRLTADETALMQTHSARSAELVGIISKFRGFIQESVRHHHERWDGKGYPAGLSGHEIPLGLPDHPGGRHHRRDDHRPPLPEAAPARGGHRGAAEVPPASQFDPEVVEHVVVVRGSAPPDHRRGRDLARCQSRSRCPTPAPPRTRGPRSRSGRAGRLER